MAHEEEQISELGPKSTLSDVIAKINEIIEQINHMWHPESE